MPTQLTHQRWRIRGQRHTGLAVEAKPFPGVCHITCNITGNSQGMANRGNSTKNSGAWPEMLHSSAIHKAADGLHESQLHC